MIPVNKHGNILDTLMHKYFFFFLGGGGKGWGGGRLAITILLHGDFGVSRFGLTDPLP